MNQIQFHLQKVKKKKEEEDETGEIKTRGKKEKKGKRKQKKRERVQNKKVFSLFLPSSSPISAASKAALTRCEIAGPS